MNKQAPTSALPPKEQSLFKRIVKYYDQKQYKNGLKFAKQIQSNPKYSEHGETLAMKGILLYCLGKKDEARDLVKRGLTADIKSFICWHIYGLVQKSDRKYEEAIKCYLQALRFANDKLQVLRDLSVLQMQMRSFEACKETRLKLLILRPNQKACWIGYALINHLLGNYDAALNVINEFRKIQNDNEPYVYETSELLLYQNMLLLESGKLEEALNLLNDNESSIIDKTSLLETKASIMLSLKLFEEAEGVIWSLFELNTENSSYYELLERLYISRSSSDSEHKVLRIKVFTDVMEKFPRAKYPRRRILDVCEGKEFLVRADSFLRTNLRKGSPVFVQLAWLYDYPEKVKLLESLYLEYRANLDKHCSLGPISLIDNDEETINEKEPPSSSLWLSYLIAQHYNRLGSSFKAIQMVNAELEKTPTLIDFYVLLASIFKDAGDIITASRLMEEAQSLDTADRYINALCTKYMIQAGRPKDAEEMAAKFTRGTASAASYLSEMQCMWFLTENARTLYTMGKYGEALKLCHEADQHYTAIIEDQLDFHSYCLRKVTLRAYVETLRLEDRLRDHPSYSEIAKLAIEIYLHLWSFPLGESCNATDCCENELTTSELKKQRNKQRKAALRAEAEVVRTKAEANRREGQRSRHPVDKDVESTSTIGGTQTNCTSTSATSGSENNSVHASGAEGDRQQDSDAFNPEKLARPENPLDEAHRFLQPLLDLSPYSLETHCLAYEIFDRKKKPLLLLRAIQRGSKLPGSQDDPWFHECRLRFLMLIQQRFLSKESNGHKNIHNKVNHLQEQSTRDLSSTETNKETSSPGDIVDEVLLSRLPHIFSGWPNSSMTLTELNQAFMERNSTSYEHLFRGKFVQAMINSEARLQHLNDLPLPSDPGLTGVTWKVCLACLKLLQKSDPRLPPDLIEKYRVACATHFPLAAVFLTPAELELHLAASIKASAATALVGMFLPADKLSRSQQLEFDMDPESATSNSLNAASSLGYDSQLGDEEPAFSALYADVGLHGLTTLLKDRLKLSESASRSELVNGLETDTPNPPSVCSKNTEDSQRLPVGDKMCSFNPKADSVSTINAQPTKTEKKAAHKCTGKAR